MRTKFVEEKYPAWFTNGDTIAGFNTDREYSDGTVLADEFIKEHNLTVDKLCEAVSLLFELSPNEARKWWYENVPEIDIETKAYIALKQLEECGIVIDWTHYEKYFKELKQQGDN